MFKLIYQFLKTHISWLQYVFLFLSLFYFFLGVFFGIDFTDSFYHLNQALHPTDEIYSYPFLLSSIIIRNIIEIVGRDIIYLRVINSFFLLCSLLIPFFVVKIKKQRLEIIFYIACALVLFAPLNVNILGYDTLSIFVLSIIFALSTIYLKSSKLYLLILLSFLCSVAVLIRLPNILVLALVFLSISISEKIKRKGFLLQGLKHPLLFLFLSLSFLYVGYRSYYLDTSEFLKVSTNATSHDFAILFYNYFQHGLILIINILIIIIGYYVFKTFEKQTSKFLLYGMLGLFYTFFCGYFIILSKYSVSYSLFITSFTISVLVLQILHNNKKTSSDQLLIYLYILFLFINPFGSNTGLLKAVSLFLLFPFILSVIDLKLKPYWLLILSVLFPLSIIEKNYSAYEDSEIFSLNTNISLELLNPVKTTEARADFLEKMDIAIKELKENNVQVYFYGDKRHIFNYLYPNTSLSINSFSQPIDELEYYLSLEKSLQGKPRTAVFVIDSYPSNIVRDESPIEKWLMQDGFTGIYAEPMVYYLRLKK